MTIRNTPPSSPNSIMDNEELFDDDVEIVQDEDEEIEIIEGDGENVDEENNDDPLDSDEEDIIPSRDDADCVFYNHKGSVFCCHIEPRLGHLAVTGAEDDRAFVWDTDTGNIMLECKGHTDSVVGAEFNYDGSYVATGDMKGMIQVWKMSSKSVIWDTTVDELTWLKWHPAANVLLTACDLGDVYVWKVPSGECKILSGNGRKTDCGLIMPDGKRAVVGYDDGTIRVFDMKMTTCLHQIQTAHSDLPAVTCLDASSDNNLLIAGSLSGKAFLVTTQNGKVAATLPTDGPITAGPSDTPANSTRELLTFEAVGFCKDSSLSLAAAGNLSGVLYIWDVSHQVTRHVVNVSTGISRLLWDRDTSNVFVSCLDGSVKLYDCRSGSLVRDFLGHRRDILDIALSRDGSKLLSGSDDKTARIFSVVSVDR